LPASIGKKKKQSPDGFWAKKGGQKGGPGPKNPGVQNLKELFDYQKKKGGGRIATWENGRRCTIMHALQKACTQKKRRLKNTRQKVNVNNHVV